MDGLLGMVLPAEPGAGVAGQPPVGASGGGITLDRFMQALSGQESGGNYTARNSRTGAYGKYQILPSNWPAWAKEAGIPGAPATPENQEIVARFKIQQYYNTYGNWADVASVWYSGQPLSAFSTDAQTRGQGPSGSETSILSYVNNILMNAGGSSSSMPSTDWQARYNQTYAKWEPLDRRVRPYGDDHVFYRQGVGLIGVEPVGIQSDPTKPGYGTAQTKEVVLLSEAEYQEWDTLTADIDRLEAEYEAGGGDLQDAIQRATFNYSMDPRNIDAENAAAAYGRELDVRQQATSVAATRIQNQHEIQNDAEDSFNSYMGGSNNWGSTFRAPRMRLPSAEDIYKQSIEDVKKGLPEVPGRPYYSGPPLPDGNRLPFDSLRPSSASTTEGQTRTPWWQRTADFFAPKQALPRPYQTAQDLVAGGATGSADNPRSYVAQPRSAGGSWGEPISGSVVEKPSSFHKVRGLPVLPKKRWFWGL